jgi:hypothetical protein
MVVGVRNGMAHVLNVVGLARIGVFVLGPLKVKKNKNIFAKKIKSSNRSQL